MGRYNPPPLVLEPSLESLQMLTRAIQKDLDEAIYLTGLKTRLSALQSNTVTSAEQLFIKSSIATVIGRETMLSLSLEAMRINPNFNPTVSQEGVGDMVKSAINTVVEKIKQFFAWIRGLFAKVFNRNEQRADQCAEAVRTTDSVKKNAAKAQEDLRKSGDSLKESMDNLDKSSEKMNKAMDDIKKTESKPVDRSKELDMLIELARRGLVSTDKEKMFLIRKSKSYPFKTKQHFREFKSCICDVFIKNVSVIHDNSYNIQNNNSDELLESVSKRLIESSAFGKFFDKDTDQEGLITYSLKRNPEDSGEFSYKAEDLDWLLLDCQQLLKDIPSAIRKSQRMEKDLIIALNNHVHATDSEVADKHKQMVDRVKRWIKINGIFMRTLSEINVIVLHISEDCLAVVDKLEF